MSHNLLVLFQCILSDKHTEVELLVRFADEKGQGCDACAPTERHFGRIVQSKCEIEVNFSVTFVDQREHGKYCRGFMFAIETSPFHFIFFKFQSIISPSDNAGLPMLSSTENYQYPVLVEQMTYRTQLEKNEYLSNTWTFNDILVRLLDIVSYPIKSKIDNIQNRCGYAITSINASIHQKLIDNCCHLLARVLSEIVFQSCPPEVSR